MGFLRVKKIKGNEYAYLVVNKWTDKGPRQEVKRYLGRVHRFDGNGGSSVNFDLDGKKEFLVGLVNFELSKIGKKIFDEGIEFDGGKLRFLKGKKNCVLGLNEGFMCDYTLGRILRFRKTDDIEVDSVKLAKFFIEAGFEVPKEAFIEYFERI